MNAFFSHPLAITLALPWLVVPIVTAFRLSCSKRLADESAEPPASAPLVSVIVPARNERRNIGECLAALLASTYPAMEIIVVDDHSSDGTGDIARATCGARVQVIDNPELPSGWFGKQWACMNGARAARGEILVFVDADARVAPETITLSVNGMLRTGADLYSVLGGQTMVTFWEKLIQPQIFSVLAMRYGGTESVNRSPRVTDKIANGQYLMMRRAAYDELGGHALVRGYVAEDLMLAQKVFASGRMTVLVMGRGELTTRMYTSLRELIDGWGKNVYAGGREAVPLGWFGRALFPIMLPLPPLVQLAPVMVLLVAAFAPISPAFIVWALIATILQVAWWIAVYVANALPPWYALCFPIGASMTLYIMLRAIIRGTRVAWKGREYESGAID